ncbi:hypothetical protein DFA_04254 [Cavenderia fasciculata]|uniref:Uncharacterized protein n=1 Tax=Cavenderia fasciculata TaxID=261658 RepID=F4PP23_CACFS|nr:uncharacterized protein DFA_04254 [Cavenderia fasciculata]EGG22136.1 hypothetical protein DFA_04254 [Cavenderia fasciculata]|eukprot:XP_004359987.1 hypothetical protein DFA_04254 [Cavenderia fasciculata]
MNKFTNKLFRKSVQLSPSQTAAINNNGANVSPILLGGGSGAYSSSGNLLSSSSTSSASAISNSTSTSFINYHRLPTIDFDQIFQSFLKEGEIVKSYYLVHCVLSRKGPSSSGNLQQQHSPKSWQPFFKKNSSPTFIVLCSSVLLLIDASAYPFTLLRRINRDELSELLIDSSDVGLFSIELNISKQAALQPHRINSIQNNMLYFSAATEKRDLLDQFEGSFVDAFKDLVSNGSLVIRRCNMLATEQQIQKKELKENVTKLLDELSLMGFSAQDLWDGDVDLKLFVSKVKEFIVLNGDDRFIVEFILPAGDGPDGVCKKVFRVPNNLSSKDIVHFLCTKIQQPNSHLYSLCTIKGREIQLDDNLSEYGLGSFFDKWQLCLVERGKVRRAGIFELEVHFPEAPEYQGKHQRIIEVDGYMPAIQLVKEIAKKMDIHKPHLYTVKMEPQQQAGSPSVILNDDEVLTKYGLGSRFRKCKLRLVAKKYPKASLDKQKIQSIIQDVVESSWKEYSERSKVVKEVRCREIIDHIIGIAVDECIRASALSMRIASLGVTGRLAMYKYLTQKEQEELNYYKMAGQKRLVDDAKDMIHNLTAVLGPSVHVDIDQDNDEKSMRVRIPPPPPPPILGFKNFKPKKPQTTNMDGSSSPSSIASSQSKSSQNLKNTGGNASLGGALDMSQILAMREKLKTAAPITKKEVDGPLSPDSILKSVKLRGVNQPPPAQQIHVTNSKETNELMLKLQKRNAVVQSQDAEELGDF